MKINKILVANRGEIAVRIIRASRELAIPTVQAYSEADRDSLAVRFADESVNIGASKASKSYLNPEVIIKAAISSGANAIHPGYGFLSENADFAQAVEQAGLIFIGPSSDIIRLMGDKVAGRQIAAKAGVPTVPGSDGPIADLKIAQKLAKEIGFPVLIKAAAGGGGRGIRTASNVNEFDEQALQAGTEAKAAFGDGRIYIEKFIQKSRHLEVQILGDGKNSVHVFERECSLQRRRQKIWEEAPAITIPSEVREKLCKAAVDLAQSVSYCGAGTIEFLYDESSKDFYFIEMNTRIQVEHTVTEMITGIDLVREMINIANGNPLSLTQDQITMRGHAIEVRINAEDPTKQFMPTPGAIDSLHLPGGHGTRFDTMLYQGCVIPPYYDSLLGKLIVWDNNRELAIKRLSCALKELQIAGVKTTKPLFQELCKSEEVKQGNFDTNWLESWLANNIKYIKS